MKFGVEYLLVTLLGKVDASKELWIGKLLLKLVLLHRLSPEESTREVRKLAHFAQKWMNLRVF